MVNRAYIGVRVVQSLLQSLHFRVLQLQSCAEDELIVGVFFATLAENGVFLGFDQLDSVFEDLDVVGESVLHFLAGGVDLPHACADHGPTRLVVVVG